MSLITLGTHSLFWILLLFLFFYWLVDKSANLGDLILAIRGLHALSPRRQLEFLSCHKLKDLVRNHQGVEQVHAALRFLVQHVSHRQSHNVGG